MCAVPSAALAFYAAFCGVGAARAAVEVSEIACCLWRLGAALENDVKIKWAALFDWWSRGSSGQPGQRELAVPAW